MPIYHSKKQCFLALFRSNLEKCASSGYNKECWFMLSCWVHVAILLMTFLQQQV